jgi:hypothetical protein
MRTGFLLLGLLTTALTIDARPAAAQAYDYPWCHQQGGRDGVLNCSYVSYRQCIVNVVGDGGWCLQNPWYQGAPAEAVHRTRRRSTMR